MLHLTPRAARQVESMRKALPDQGRNLRVLVETGGCSGLKYGMSFDERKEGDVEIDSEGVLMLVDPKSLEHLRESSIDFDDGLHGKGFEIRNPNAHSTCGCGKSFN